MAARLPPMFCGSGRVSFSPRISTRWVRLARRSKEQQISKAAIINIVLLHLLIGICPSSVPQGWRVLRGLWSIKRPEWFPRAKWVTLVLQTGG